MLLLLSLLGYLGRFPLLKPLRITLHLVVSNLLSDAALPRLVFPLFELLLVHLLVESVHFAHLLDFVQVHNEASLVGMVLLDAFTTENGEVVRAVEVLDPLVMLLAQQTVDTIFILEIDVSQDTVALNDLI